MDWIKKPLPPCKDCENRFANCHAVCDEYRDYKTAMKQFKNDMHIIKSNDYEYKMRDVMRKRNLYKLKHRKWGERV